MITRMPTLVFAAAAIALNVAIGSIVHLLKLPIYLDSMGIMLVAILLPGSRWSAFLTAAVVGVVSFVITGLLINPFLPWFSLTGIAGAAYGAFLVRGRVQDELTGRRGAHVLTMKAVLFGIGWGILAAIVSAPVVVYLFGGVTGSGTTLVTAFLVRTGHQLLEAALLTGFAAEPIDKTLQMLIALIIGRATPRTFLERF